MKSTMVFHHPLWIIVSALLILNIAGCSITIRTPANNATVTSPVSTLITGNSSFTNLTVSVDGTDFTSSMVSTGSGSSSGSLTLPAGSHTITATASVPCWYCSGGRTTSTSTKSFVVVNSNTIVCARSGNVPVITLPTSLASAGQQPGRRQIGYQLQNGEGILIIVDDAPGLLPTQMLVEVDLDPSRGVTKSKMIEAWAFCQSGTMVNAVTAGIAGGFGTGVICNPLTNENNLRSGCTNFSPAMLIDQSTTSELWLRKQGTFGNWDYVEAIDQSIWQVFGGRRLRFIWFKD